MALFKDKYFGRKYYFTKIICILSNKQSVHISQTCFVYSSNITVFFFRIDSMWMPNILIWCLHGKICLTMIRCFFFLFAFMQIIFIPHYLNQILHMLSKSASLISTRSKTNTTDKHAASISSFRFTSYFIQLLDQYYQYLFMCKLKIVLFSAIPCYLYLCSQCMCTPIWQWLLWNLQATQFRIYSKN